MHTLEADAITKLIVNFDIVITQLLISCSNSGGAATENKLTEMLYCIEWVS